MEKEKIYCFDFDGTLTTSDTLIEFIKFAKGSRQLLWGFLRYSPLLVLMKLHLYPNWKAKQKLFAYYFSGMRLEVFNNICEQFASQNQHLLRFAGIRLILKAIQDGAKVFIVSASIDNWVRPFFLLSGIEPVEVLGTQIEVIDNRVTGKFLSKNCYGQEKVNRICQALQLGEGDEIALNKERYDIEAFGDSQGDAAMLAFAHRGHFKPFRK